MGQGSTHRGGREAEEGKRERPGVKKWLPVKERKRVEEGKSEDDGGRRRKKKKKKTNNMRKRKKKEDKEEEND